MFAQETVALPAFRILSTVGKARWMQGVAGCRYCALHQILARHDHEAAVATVLEGYPHVFLASLLLGRRSGRYALREDGVHVRKAVDLDAVAPTAATHATTGQLTAGETRVKGKRLEESVARASQR